MIKALGRSEYNPANAMPLSGVEYHRQYMPWEYMRNAGPLDFNFNFDGKNLHKQDDTTIDLSEFDLYHVVRKDVKVVNDKWTDAGNMLKVKEYGLPIIIDFDDLWRLDTTHALYSYYRDNRVDELSILWMERADHVTTTTPRLAEHIRKYNNNVTVIPNALHPLLPQFAWSLPDKPALQFWEDPSKNERNRLPNIGWCGSIHHVNDLTLLNEYFRKYWASNLCKQSNLILGGFLPEQPHYQHIAQIMAGGRNNPLKIINALPVEQYATMYKYFDIALVPLADNEFNRCKSELKIIEAGHFGIPVIASNVYPYNTVIEHGYNGYLISNSKDCHKQWLKYTQELVNDPVLRYHMGQNLKRTILDKFNIAKSNEIRFNLYRKLCKK